jgi:hypothetical protein
MNVRSPVADDDDDDDGAESRGAVRRRRSGRGESGAVLERTFGDETGERAGLAWELKYVLIGMCRVVWDCMCEIWERIDEG